LGFGSRFWEKGGGEGMMCVCYGLYTLEARVGRDSLGMGEEEWSTNAVTCWQRILGMNTRYCTHMCIWLNYITFSVTSDFAITIPFTSRTSKYLTPNKKGTVSQRSIMVLADPVCILPFHPI
jgi:hypothetical protein